jgi:hypothetical protein
MTDPLSYYAKQGAALFPIPAGRKAPGGIVESFKDNASRDPAQWAKWRAEHPGCNFGVVAFASNWITLDTDIKPIEGQTKEDARAEAWAMRGELFKSWGMDPDTLPHVESAHGGWHDHFALPAGIDATTLRQPDAIRGRINVRVKGYTVAAGGYYDGSEKNDAPGHYQLFANAGPPHPAPPQLLEHCSPAKPREVSAAIGTHDIDDTKALYKWMAENGAIQSDDDWRNAGMAAKIEFGDAGLDVWGMLATRAGGLTSESMTRWNSFDTEPSANAVTLKSILKLAKDNGWTGSIRPSMSSMFAGVAQLAGSPDIPLPIGAPGPSNPAAEFEAAHPTPPGGFTKSLAQSLAGFMPPDYLIDGILQRRFCYSMTGQTGTGKTCVAMRAAAHVAIGKPIGDIGVEQGDVLYFAGENPTDVQMRWLGLCKEMGLDPDKLPIHVVEGSMHLSQVAERITQEVIAIGRPMALVIVDTAAAYFEEDNDNDNVQAGNHARRLRSLCGLPGGPCVLVLCHPTKNAQDDNLVPRGGGAFLNEVDGNIALRRDGETIVAFALGKFRGPEFTPINFGLKVIRDHPSLVDTKGRPVPTIVAIPISAAEHQRQEERAQSSEDKVLELLCNEPGLKQKDICDKLGWASHSSASRILRNLVDEKLVKSTRGYWTATPEGQKSLNLVAGAAARPVRKAAPLTPAVLGGAAFPTPARPGSAPPMPPVPS